MKMISQFFMTRFHCEILLYYIILFLYYSFPTHLHLLSCLRLFVLPSCCFFYVFSALCACISVHCICSVYLCVCVSVVIVVTVCECSCSCICEFCSSALSCQLHVSATFRFRLFASSCCCCCCAHCCCCCCFCLALLLMESGNTTKRQQEQSECWCWCRAWNSQLPIRSAAVAAAPCQRISRALHTHTHTRRETDKDTPGHTQIQNGRRLAQVLGLCNLYLCVSLSLSPSLAVCLSLLLALLNWVTWICNFSNALCHFSAFPLFHFSLFSFANEKSTTSQHR